MENKTKEFIISSNPSPAEIVEQLAYVTNTIAFLTEQISKLKNIVADAEDYYKQLCDEKYLMYSDEYPRTNQIKLKALVNTDEDVVKAKAVLQEAKAKLVIAEGNYKSWDNRYITLRKIGTLKTVEMQTIER